jgi:hypothetical protein
VPELRNLGARQLSFVDAIALLRQAGWESGRWVDTEEEVAALLGVGCLPWPGLENFLHNFSGLEIRDITFVPARVLWISAERACMQTDQPQIAEYSERADSQIAPIGGYSHMTIYLSQNDALLGGYDGEFGVLGQSLIECVETLFTSHQFIRSL